MINLRQILQTKPPHDSISWNCCCCCCYWNHVNHTLHGSFLWSNKADPMAHIGVAATGFLPRYYMWSKLLLGFQVQRADEMATAPSCGICLERIYRRPTARTMFSLAVKTRKAIVLTYLQKSNCDAGQDDGEARMQFKLFTTSTGEGKASGKDHV